MNNSSLNIITTDNKLSLKFQGEFDLYTVSTYEKQLKMLNFSKFKSIDIDLSQTELFDTAAAIFINSL
jgi:phospholipid/cholesterol/gamma-HCH transport system permease protein